MTSIKIGKFFALKVCFFKLNINGFWVKNGIFIEAVKVMRKLIKKKIAFID